MSSPMKGLYWGSYGWKATSGLVTRSPTKVLQSYVLLSEMPQHLEILVEELSAETFLSALLPRLLGDGATFRIHSFQGKSDLLANLERRLMGYARWIPDSTRIVVLVDRDDA